MPASHFAKRNGSTETLVVNDSKNGSTVLQGDRSRQARFLIAMLAVLLVVVALFSLTAGASQASSWSVLKSLFSSQVDPNDIAAQRDHIIIFDIRLPRIVLGILIGASLAVSGAVMQGLFRNPNRMVNNATYLSECFGNR
jgi:iron complex transport system permease protein